MHFGGSLHRGAAAMLLLLVFGGAHTLLAQQAIFTTTADGLPVNENIFESKQAVYLNGGPPRCDSGGLPDGRYYFQVTDPSGAVLLSTDPVGERMFRMAGGVIVEYLGTTHAIGDTGCGGPLTVGLAPFIDTPNRGGEYKVWVTPVVHYDPLGSGFHGFLPKFSKTDNFKVWPGGEPPPPPAAPDLSGRKFLDLNANGIDEGEAGIVGVRIDNCVLLANNELACTQITATEADGRWSYAFPVEQPYIICEELPSSTPGLFWVQTAPGPNPDGHPNLTTQRCYSGIMLESRMNLDFGDVCLGGGGGLTLGFWSNKNGRALFGAGDLALLVSLNLRNADGSPFDPPSYAAFRTWLLSATATNMAYMLSAQLAAMELNVLNGFVDGSALIYAPGTGSANPAGFAIVNAVMAEADAALAANGLVPSGSPDRPRQEALKNALDRANNNQTFVQPAPCPVVYP